MRNINANIGLENLLKEVAEKHKVDADLVQRLIAFEGTKVHLEKRRGAKEQIRKIIESSIDDGGNS